MRRVILLVGARDDPPIGAVAAELSRRGERSIVIDPAERSVDVIRAWSPETEAVISDGASTIALSSVAAAYLRPQAPGALSDGGRRALSTVVAWADVTPACVVNRPRACAANTSKPYQLALIRRTGFATPATLVTTSPDAAARFADHYGRVIYKSTSGERSIVRELLPTERDRLRDAVHCPTQFQEFVDGSDIRVHVVGENVHAIRIECAQTDYRYLRPGDTLPTATVVELDPETCQRVRAMTQAMGLTFAGIDLRETSDGALYCLEVNPAPGFTFFERLSGHPIAPLVADVLVNGTSTTNRGEPHHATHRANLRAVGNLQADLRVQGDRAQQERDVPALR